MEQPLYLRVKDSLKNLILSGEYRVGDLLPSENELAARFHLNRATVRQALSELVNEGYIVKHKGKGSIVRERRNSLGLLSIRGFSEVVGNSVNTRFIRKPLLTDWPDVFPFALCEAEKEAGAIYFKRLRYVDETPVMLEETYIANIHLPRFCQREFVKDSFFQTLNKVYHIEIKGVEQELRAISSDLQTAALLQVPHPSPILFLTLRFATNRRNLFVYSSLWCNTSDYPIGNQYMNPSGS